MGTDGSERAGRAVTRAVELAALSGATLHVIHAYQGTRDSIVAAGRAVADRVQQELADCGATVETHALQGNPADVMVAWAEEHGADLIVVGNRGMTGAGRILGSVPAAIAREAPCAVLIVPTQ